MTSLCFDFFVFFHVNRPEALQNHCAFVYSLPSFGDNSSSPCITCSPLCSANLRRLLSLFETRSVHEPNFSAGGPIVKDAVGDYLADHDSSTPELMASLERLIGDRAEIIKGILNAVDFDPDVKPTEQQVDEAIDEAKVKWELLNHRQSSPTQTPSAPEVVLGPFEAFDRSQRELLS
jgi:hypothetical protein